MTTIGTDIINTTSRQQAFHCVLIPSFIFRHNTAIIISSNSYLFSYAEFPLCVWPLH